MKYLIIFLGCLKFSYGQIILQDSASHEIVPIVEITNSQGKILGFSNENGIIEKKFIFETIKNGEDILTFKHISHKTCSYRMSEIIKGKTIFLSNSPLILPEIIIKPIQNPKNIILKGYTRGYVIIDNLLRYYADGIIEIVYPRYSNQEILIKRFEERSMFREMPKDDFFELFILSPTIPDMNLMNSKSKEVFNYINEGDSNYFLFPNAKAEYERRNIKYSIANNAIIQNIAFIQPNDKIEYSFFGNKTKFNYHNESSVYFSTDSSKITLYNLKYHKEVRKYEYMRKGKDKYHDIEIVQEFFPDSVQLSNIKLNGYTEKMHFHTYCNYVDPFWQNLSKTSFIKPLDFNLERRIKLELKEYPNKN